MCGRDELLPSVDLSSSTGVPFTPVLSSLSHSARDKCKYISENLCPILHILKQYLPFLYVVIRLKQTNQNVTLQPRLASNLQQFSCPRCAPLCLPNNSIFKDFSHAKIIYQYPTASPAGIVVNAYLVILKIDKVSYIFKSQVLTFIDNKKP